MVKVTYSLDDVTVRRIRLTADRLGKPLSLVVREAVADYAARTDRLSESERLRLLTVINRLRAHSERRALDAERQGLRGCTRSRDDVGRRNA